VDDADAPQNCGALVSVEVVPLAAPAAASSATTGVPSAATTTTSAPTASASSGFQCFATGFGPFECFDSKDECESERGTILRRLPPHNTVGAACFSQSTAFCHTERLNFVVDEIASRIVACFASSDVCLSTQAKGLASSVAQECPRAFTSLREAKAALLP
jgi:hypothetical protein